MMTHLVMSRIFFAILIIGIITSFYGIFAINGIAFAIGFIFYFAAFLIGIGGMLGLYRT